MMRADRDYLTRITRDAWSKITKQRRQKPKPQIVAPKRDKASAVKKK